MPGPDQTQTPAQGQPAGPCAFVIFGATGDLTKRLLIPALYNLLVNKLLPDRFAIVGYETLLLDCMIGDPPLFQRADTVDAGWRVVDPISTPGKRNPDFPNYAAGSRGPRAANELLACDGCQWRLNS